MARVTSAFFMSLFLHFFFLFSAFSLLFRSSLFVIQQNAHNTHTCIAFFAFTDSLKAKKYWKRHTKRQKRQQQQKSREKSDFVRLFVHLSSVYVFWSWENKFFPCICIVTSLSIPTRHSFFSDCYFVNKFFSLYSPHFAISKHWKLSVSFITFWFFFSLYFQPRSELSKTV